MRTPPQKCTGCFDITYSSQEEQRADWTSHKSSCASTREKTCSLFLTFQNIFDDNKSDTHEAQAGRILEQLNQYEIQYFFRVCIFKKFPTHIESLPPRVLTKWKTDIIDYKRIEKAFTTLSCHNKILDETVNRVLNEYKHSLLTDLSTDTSNQEQRTTPEQMNSPIPGVHENFQNMSTLNLPSLPTEPPHSIYFLTNKIFKSSLQTPLKTLKKQTVADLILPIPADKTHHIITRLQQYVDYYSDKIFPPA